MCWVRKALVFPQCTRAARLSADRLLPSASPKMASTGVLRRSASAAAASTSGRNEDVNQTGLKGSRL